MILCQIYFIVYCLEWSELSKRNDFYSAWLVNIPVYSDAFILLREFQAFVIFIKYFSKQMCRRHR